DKLERAVGGTDPQPVDLSRFERGRFGINASCPHLEALAPEGGPRAAEAYDSVELGRGTGPIELELGGVDLLGVGDLADLGLWLAEAVLQRFDEQSGADVDERAAQLGEGVVGPDRHRGGAVDTTGVE